MNKITIQLPFITVVVFIKSKGKSFYDSVTIIGKTILPKVCVLR
jgi:hypothetical protein